MSSQNDSIGGNSESEAQHCQMTCPGIPSQLGTKAQASSTELRVLATAVYRLPPRRKRQAKMATFKCLNDSYVERRKVFGDVPEADKDSWMAVTDKQNSVRLKEEG